MITCIKVPSTSSIQFHGIDTMGNTQLGGNMHPKVPKFQVSDIPIAIQIDDIKSLFLQVWYLVLHKAVNKQLNGLLHNLTTNYSKYKRFKSLFLTGLCFRKMLCMNIRIQKFVD